MVRFCSSLSAINVLFVRGLSKSPVIIEDGVESVSDGKHSTALELCSNGVLYMIICGHVHSCRGFVQNQNAGLPEQCSGQADQLALTHTEVRYSMCCVKYHRCMETYEYVLSLFIRIENCDMTQWQSKSNSVSTQWQQPYLENILLYLYADKHLHAI